MRKIDDLISPPVIWMASPGRNRFVAMKCEILRFNTQIHETRNKQVEML